jgi:hypothetical protein
MHGMKHIRTFFCGYLLVLWLRDKFRLSGVISYSRLKEWDSGWR